MTHFRCIACRIRLRLDGAAGELCLCPECGILLEPVSDLTALVGFREVGAHDRLAAQIRSALAAQGTEGQAPRPAT